MLKDGIFLTTRDKIKHAPGSHQPSTYQGSNLYLLVSNGGSNITLDRITTDNFEGIFTNANKINGILITNCTGVNENGYNIVYIDGATLKINNCNFSSQFICSGEYLNCDLVGRIAPSTMMHYEASFINCRILTTDYIYYNSNQPIGANFFNCTFDNSNQKSGALISCRTSNGKPINIINCVINSNTNLVYNGTQNNQIVNFFNNAVHTTSNNFFNASTAVINKAGNILNGQLN